MKKSRIFSTVTAVVFLLLILPLAGCTDKEPQKTVPDAYKTVDWREDLAYRPESDPATVLLEKTDSAPLRILQLTDIHYDDHNALSSRRAAVLTMLRALITEQRPHLVAVTGDWGSNSFHLLAGEAEKYADMYPDIAIARDTAEGETILGLREARSREVFDTIDAACAEVGAVWAPVFGNHDDEGDLSKFDYADLFSSYENCLFRAGYQNLKGVGNYVVAVREEGSLTQALFFLDSHRSLTYGSSKYDALGKSQIAWFSWAMRGLSALYPSQNESIPALIFQHIPLPEYPTAYRKAFGTQNHLIGCNREKEYPSYKNTGMFAAALASGGVQGIFTGHDHDNNSAVLYKGVTLAYGVQSGWCDEYAAGSQKGALLASMKKNALAVTHCYYPLASIEK